MASKNFQLKLAGAIATLCVLALAASCRGFFVKPTLTAVGITPATPTITDTAPNNKKQFSVVGTFNDGSSGSTSVTWGSDSPTTVARIDANTGLATAVGIGKATITATSTILPTISGTTTLTVVPGNVTSINVTPSSQSIATGATFELLAKDQSGHDLSGSVTFTFTLHGTTTVETGFTKGTPDAGGQPFTVGTLSPAVTLPVTLDAVATLTVNGTTVTSNTVTVTITS